MDSRKIKESKKVRDVIAALHQIFLSSDNNGRAAHHFDNNVVSEAKHLKVYFESNEKEFIDEIRLDNR